MIALLLVTAPQCVCISSPRVVDFKYIQLYLSIVLHKAGEEWMEKLSCELLPSNYQFKGKYFIYLTPKKLWKEIVDLHGKEPSSRLARPGEVSDPGTL